MVRKESIQKDGIYHIYNRGVNREKIFFLKKNWSFFLYRLTKYLKQTNNDLLVYCLMPNHFHLLIHVRTADFGKKVIMPFITAYTKAINIQEKRVGPLFQGSYKFSRIESEEDLLFASRYIHLNPVSAGLVSQPEDWAFSSYKDYLGLRSNQTIQKEKILSCFKDVDSYRRFVEEQ